MTTRPRSSALRPGVSPPMELRTPPGVLTSGTVLSYARPNCTRPLRVGHSFRYLVHIKTPVESWAGQRPLRKDLCSAVAGYVSSVRAWLTELLWPKDWDRPRGRSPGNHYRRRAAPV